MPRQVSTHQIENSPRPGRANYQQSPAVKRRESRRYSEAQLEEIIHGLNNENESKPSQRHSGKTDKSYKSGKSKKAKKKKKVEKVSESENTVFSSSEAEKDDEKYSYKKKSKGRRASVIRPASSKTSSTRKTRSKHAMTSSSDSSDGSSTDYEDRDQEARRHEKYLNSFMDEDQEDDFKEYTTKTKSKCWTSFQDFVEKIITNPTYHKIFLLLVVIDTTLVYTELLIGMMAENLDTCDCPNACEDWCLLPPEIHPNSTESARFLQILPLNGSDGSGDGFFTTDVSTTTTATTTTTVAAEPTPPGNECCKYQRLLQTWIRMGYTTFALLSLFFIETIVKLTALPHLLSRKMEIADAMLVIVSWIMCFIIVFTLEEPDCEGDGGDSGGNLNGMKGVVMLTFRMLRIFNGLAMLFANFFEGKIRRYQEKIKFQTQMLNQSQEEKKRLATTAQKILRDKQNLQLQLQAVTMSYNQATQQNQPPPRGPPPAGGAFQQPPARMLALPTVHSPIPGGNTDDEALENLIEHEITAAESALASNSARVTEINDTEILRENPPSFLPPIAQGTGPSVIITPPYVPVSKSPRRSKKKDEKATLEVPQENSPQHRNTNPFDQD